MRARYAARTRVVFYDLETSIVARYKPGMPKGPKGASRRNLIVEIGAVCTSGRMFHRLVDPRWQNLTLAETFELTGQNPHRTLRFWTKLFGEKNMLVHNTVLAKKSRATLDERMCAFDDLFTADDRFVSAKIALADFTQFVYDEDFRQSLMVAHNGNSFDHSIVRAHMRRLCLPDFDKARMKDSLKPARQTLPRMKSHALGLLHKRLVGEDFENQHHALSDAQALYRVCAKIADIEKVEVHDLWSGDKGAGSLTSLRGVGPKTAKALRNGGFDMQSFRECVVRHRECPDNVKPLVRNHKSLWKTLRKKWCVEREKEKLKKHAASKQRRRGARRTHRFAARSTTRSKSV
jgi:DNA polymerase III epsilon subunit-like protein